MWIGFVLLAVGTGICLIPQRVVEAVSRRPTSVAGKAADVGAVLLLVGGLLAATATVARAQGPGGGGPRPAEHEGGADAIARPLRRLGLGPPLPPDTPLAEALMKELVCLCGGCKRENLFECAESATRPRSARRSWRCSPATTSPPRPAGWRRGGRWSAPSSASTAASTCW
ncbi:MAG: hypothetical protein HS111_03060 [Kofleriaceae bacterium]|nr:hypothetical protein [Kofleriaceae bacterium]